MVKLSESTLRKERKEKEKKGTNLWIWVRFFWMKISKSPTRSRSSDEVLLIQGTNVSDTYLIYVDEQE